MAKELYIVNTSFEPYFLDPLVASASRSQARDSFSDFANLLEGKVPAVFPLAGLFKDHEVFGDMCAVPHRFGLDTFSIIENAISGQPLHEGIAKILEGKGHSAGEIKLLVEFSRSPVYHESIARLGEQYSITKVQLD